MLRRGVVEALDDGVDLEGGLAVGSVDVAIEAAVGDDLDGVVDVVEDDHGIGEEPDGLGDADLVELGRDDARLEVTDRVVGDVADGAAGEGGDAGGDDLAEAGELLLDGDEGVALPFLAGAGADDAVGLGADEGVAGEALAAFDRFEEEAVGARGDLEVGGDGGFEVGGDFAVDRDEVALG